MNGTLAARLVAPLAAILLVAAGCSSEPSSPPASANSQESESKTPNSDDASPTAETSDQPSRNFEVDDQGVPICAQGDGSWILDAPIKELSVKPTAEEIDAGEWAKKALLDMFTNPGPAGSSLDDTQRSVADYEFARKYMSENAWTWLASNVESNTVNIGLYGMFPQTRTDRGTIDPTTGDIQMATQGMGCPEYEIEKFDYDVAYHNDVVLGLHIKTTFKGLDQAGKPTKVERLHQIILWIDKVDGQWVAGWDNMYFPTHLEVGPLE